MRIENAQISSTTISMADHSCLVIRVFVVGNGWFCDLGSYVNGFGSLGSKYWEGNGSALVYMMKLMDVVGVDRWEELIGKYVRVKYEGLGKGIDEIGNLIADKWFNVREFFQNDDGHAIYVLDERELEGEEGE